VADAGVGTLDSNLPGGLRYQLILDWSELEPVMIEGLDWLTTQEPPE